MKSILLSLVAMAIPLIVLADDSDLTTVNACIGPQACFQNANDNTVDYCISSPWSINYPKDLRKNIAKLPGFTMIDYKNADFDNCGWNMGVESIERQSVSRGSIYYKAHNASLEFRPPTFPRDTSAIINTMKHTYPTTEIMLILLFTVIIPIGLPVSFCIFTCMREFFSKRYQNHRRAKAVRRQEKVLKQERKEREKAEKEKWSPSSAAGSTLKESSEGSTFAESDGDSGKDSMGKSMV